MVAQWCPFAFFFGGSRFPHKVANPETGYALPHYGYGGASKVARRFVELIEAEHARLAQGPWQRAQDVHAQRAATRAQSRPLFLFFRV